MLIRSEEEDNWLLGADASGKLSLTESMALYIQNLVYE